MIEKHKWNKSMAFVLAFLMMLSILSPFGTIRTVLADDGDPETESNVKNAVGTDGSVWDGDPDDLETGYTKYKDEDGNEIADIRKVAEEIEPGLFDVYLNIRGKTKTRPVDVVFINDWSGSMNQNVAGAAGSWGQEAKIYKQNEAMRTILNALKNQDNLNIGFVGYSTNYGKEEIGGTTYKGSRKGYHGDNEKLAIQPANTAVPAINNLLTPLDNGVEEEGGTFTQKALLDAQALFAESDPDSRKIIVLLTDGQPTASYPITAAMQRPAGSYNDTVITNGVVATSYNTNVNPNSNPPVYIEMPMTSGGSTGFWYSGTTVNSTDYSATKPYTVDGHRINSAWPALIGTALDIQGAGIEIYGMGLNITASFLGVNDDGIEIDDNDITNAFKDITSSENHYFAVRGVDDLNNFVKAIIRGISNKTVLDALLVDPLGEQYTIESPNIEVGSMGEIEITGDALPKVSYDEENNKITSEPFTLGEGEEVQVHYQVRMKTETNDFITEEWYPMNGKTTIVIPNDKDPKNPTELEFKVPEGKAEETSLSLKKLWEEYDNDPSSRPEYIDFKVERTSVKEEGSWEEAYLRLTAESGWELENATMLSSQPGDNYNANLHMPKYNNTGEEFVYTVVSEANLPLNYTSNFSEDGSVWTNTKIFDPEFRVVKVSDQDENELLSGAEFTLSGGDLEEAVTLVGDNGIYKLPEGSKLNLDSEYTLTEVSSPDGYAKGEKTTWTINIAANGSVTIDGEAVVVEDDKIEVTVTNYQEGKVTIWHKTTDGKVLEREWTGRDNPEVKTGKIGETWDSSVGTFPGYVFVKVEDDADTSGVFTKDDQEVTYLYERRNPAIELEKTGEVEGSDRKLVTEAGQKIIYTFKVTNVGNVRVTEITIEDKMLADLGIEIKFDTTELEVGEVATGTAVYTVTAEDLEKDTIKNVAISRGEDPGDPENPPSTPPVEEEVPVGKKGEVTANYVDEDGKVIADPEIQEGIVGDSWTTEQKDIPGYEFVEIKDDKDPTGNYTEDSQEVTYVYKQVDGKVTIKHETTDGVELKTPETTTGKLGEDWGSSEESFPGYVFVKVKGEAATSGVYTMDECQ